MNAKQLLTSGGWTRSGEWPHYQGTGPRYLFADGVVEVRGYVTRTRSRKTKVWWLHVNGSPVIRGSFALCAAQAVRHVAIIRAEREEVQS